MEPARPERSQNREELDTSLPAGPTPSGHTSKIDGEGTPPSPGNDTRFPVTFTGSGSEYFRIWIVNVLLSILTLGVYSAWAKVRTKRYFSGNTVIDGSSFDYHATGMQILLGRVVAVVLLVVYLASGALSPILEATLSVLFVALLPWVIWRSMMFNQRMSSYRNVRFGFAGSLGGAYQTILLWPMLPLLAGGLVAAVAHFVFKNSQAVVAALGLAVLMTLFIFPLTQQKIAHYVLNGYRFGQAAFASTPSTGRYYGIYLRAVAQGMLLMLTGVAFIAAIIGALLATGQLSPELFASIVDAEDTEVPAQLSALVVPVALGYLFFFLGGFVIKAYVAVRLQQHLYSSTQLNGEVNFESTMRVWPVVWLIVSNLLLVVLTLGLATPWAKVRVARYHADNTILHSANGLRAVVAAEHAHQSSLGEEIGEAFDTDLDLGF